MTPPKKAETPPIIDIIKYPYSHGAALDRSFAAPDILHKISADLLSPHIGAWQDIAPLKSKPSERRYKSLRNYKAVKETVSNLGIEIGRALLKGHKPLALGGCHTQGIATVKASALILVTRAVIDGKLPIKRKSAIAALEDAADEGQVLKLGKMISEYVRGGLITRKALNDFLGSIAVIWVDSHPDYNDRHSSKSGNIHGMALAACAGCDIGGIEDLFAGDVIRLNPRNFYVLCARDIDPAERALMKRDGVNYRPWELTKPGAMRTHGDPDNPVTLKVALDKVLSALKKKQIIFSMDIDAVHAGIHKSPYGLESVAATGTPMGMRPKDVSHIFRQASNAASDDLVRVNANAESPPGPTAGDMFEALQDILQKPNIVAADLSEVSPAAGEKGKPIAERERGLTIETSIKVLGAMVGADLKNLAKALDKKIPALERLVGAAIRAEKKS
jgi:arginase family enzyme